MFHHGLSRQMTARHMMIMIRVHLYGCAIDLHHAHSTARYAGYRCPTFNMLKAITCSGHRKMKMDRIIIEHLGLVRVVVVICDDIPDPAHRSWGGFL